MYLKNIPQNEDKRTFIKAYIREMATFVELCSIKKWKIFLVYSLEIKQVAEL